MSIEFKDFDIIYEIMKKFGVISIVVSAVLMMGSCGNKSDKVPFDNGDSADVANADPTIYGICGEETSMNTLQLITDMGDTLVIDISDAQDNNKVLGGIAQATVWPC